MYNFTDQSICGIILHFVFCLLCVLPLFSHRMFHQTPNSGHPTTSIRTTHEVSRGVNNSCIFPTYPLFSPRLHTVALSMARLEDVSPGSSIVPAHVIVANRVFIRSIAPSLAMSPCAAALTRHQQIPWRLLCILEDAATMEQSVWPGASS